LYGRNFPDIVILTRSPLGLGSRGGLWFCQLHLAEDGTDDQHFGSAADLFADVSDG
jgi:hypothetical protein